MMNLNRIFLQLQFKSSRMDDFLFKVVNGAVEIVKSPFQVLPSEKVADKLKQIFDEAVRVPSATQHTVPPLRLDTVPPLRSMNRAFPSQACECGNFNLVSNPAGRDFDRIVGGFVAPPNSIPYQVGIWYKKYD